MKVTLESTSKVITVNGVPARIWEGKTESGIPVHAFITRIAVPEGANQEQFQKELLECIPPSPAVAAYALRLIL